MTHIRISLAATAFASAIGITALIANSADENPKRADMLKNGHVGDCAGCHGRRDVNRFAFDKGQSRVIFRIDNFGYATSVGTFRGIDGGFVFDPKNPEKGSVVASVPADDVDTGSVMLNSVLRSERFFDSGRFPAIGFTGSAIRKTGDNTGQIRGKLTIRGVTRPLVLDVLFNKAGPHPVTRKRMAGFSATGSLRRSDFGMTLGLPEIGDEIALEIQAVGRSLD